MRKPLIAANWKMYHTPTSGAAMLRQLVPLAQDAEAEIVVCTPATHLAAAAAAVAGSNIRLGAENMHWETEGAFTGEISAPMLLDLSVSHVILGHSERRAYCGETNEQVSRKGAAAVRAGLIPILCVGETEEQRTQGRAMTVIEQQLAGSLAFWSGEEEIIIAYEPIWAIGTGLTATADDAETTIGQIRQWLRHRYGERATEIRLLYGGSVKPQSIGGLMAKPNIDGALVGGASLQAESFSQIIHY